ncbi:MAG: hypothetical protein ACRDZ6_06700, partial [Acidimicrobiales bacterium]
MARRDGPGDEPRESPSELLLTSPTGEPPPPSTPRARSARGEDHERRRAELAASDTWRPKWLWAGLAVPGGLWLILLFVVPLYAMIAVAAGQLDPLFRTPIATWNPLHWTGTNFQAIWT